MKRFGKSARVEIAPCKILDFCTKLVDVRYVGSNGLSGPPSLHKRILFEPLNKFECALISSRRGLPIWVRAQRLTFCPVCVLKNNLL
jgi:hypothetical protein